VSSPDQGGSTYGAALSLERNMEPKSFNPGRPLATPEALAAVPGDRILQCFEMHLRCNWGDALPHADWRLNDAATHDGSRLFSSYWIDPLDKSKGKLWIITEAEDDNGVRQSTTILLPENY